MTPSGPGEQGRWFERSGLAALEDLSAPDLCEAIETLEHAQERFLARENAFRSPAYPWPRDALHQWSRIWEYPYVLRNLQGLLASAPEKPQHPRGLDFGSGVTFFPFALAAIGARITGYDIDPRVERDFRRAARVMEELGPPVDFTLGEGDSLPFPEGTFDFAYSVSVLEHVTRPWEIVPELARVLAPGGLLLLTVDICLHGEWALGAADLHRLREALQEHFSFFHPDRTVHPAALLRFENGPHSYARGFPLRRRVLRGARRILHALSLSRPPTDCTVMGLALQKARAQGSVTGG